MARETANLKLYLPEDNEFYDVEKDQNENFEKIDTWSKNVNDNLANLEKNKSNINHLHDDRYYTETEVDEMLKKYCPYGVGDYLYTENSTHPAIRWVGTTWVRVVDKFLLGAGNTYTVGAEGGATQIQLTVNNLPVHSHTYSSSFNWGHTHSYSNSINLAHNHTYSSNFNWAHTHYYSNSINWSHSHSQPAHSHTQPEHQHVVTWGEANINFPYGTITGNNKLGTKGNHDFDNNWMLTSPAGGENTGAAAPNTNAAGGVTSFSGNTGSSGSTSVISGTTANAGTVTSFSGNTGSSGTTSTIGGTTASIGSGQSFSLMNPYRAVFIWRRTA